MAEEATMSGSLLKGVFRRDEMRLKEKEECVADEPDSVPCTPITPVITTFPIKIKNIKSAGSDNGGLKSQVISEQTNGSAMEDPTPEAYITFSVRIRLKEGRNLVIRDSSGAPPFLSVVHKSLNPVWEEEFTLLIDDPTMPIQVDVYDYDRWATDDYMGGAVIDLSQLKLFQMTIMKLKLHEEGCENSGAIDVVVTVTPLTAHEKDEFLKKATRGIICERPKKTPPKTTQVWTSVVNIVLVEGRKLSIPDSPKNSFPDSFVKFKLGGEKYKSKPVLRSSNPKWLEQFDLHMFDETKHVLEMIVIDKRTNIPIGKCTLDLDKLEKETPNQLLCELDRGNGSILLLISVTGTTSTDAVVDLSDFSNDDIRNVLLEKYVVFRARNLAPVDAMNKSNPFAVVELVNALLQTHTEYKTVNPEWNKLFTFAVKDIHTALEITVYDEDASKKAEFLGKVEIPLLQIRNCESKWYVLKDRKLRSPTKGQILLEMDVIWNPVSSSKRLMWPKNAKSVSIKNDSKIFGMGMFRHANLH
ncbi:unnamed protein product [Gongylonema pulchrum]|uniref:C2 domain-containing protein n=1 Tax=Gongylonema pulchrum TaxID=637853 RepID=A0A183E381_9BILA|nr:unnamed protein product [Gongylonema pulchrum]